MWSIACMAKFQVMNSTIGLSPAKRRADADAGKAMLGDRRVDHAPRAELLAAGPGSPCRRPGIAPTSSPIMNTSASRRISSAMASRSASRTVMRHHLGAGRNFGVGTRLGRCHRGPQALPSTCSRLAEICVLHGAIWD